MKISYAHAPVLVRDDIIAAHAVAWDRIANPGTWFDGAARVAIAAETRNALHCALCARRKLAVSPFGTVGPHQSLGTLPERMVEQIHRIVTDPGRLTRTWYEQVLASGIPDTEYVEIVGVVVTVVSIDTFCRALGIPAHPLPEPVVGEPLRRRPIGAMRVGSLDRRTATDGSDSVLGLDRAYESGSAGGSAAYLPCHGSMRICSDYLRDMAS